MDELGETIDELLNKWKELGYFRCKKCGNITKFYLYPIGSFEEVTITDNTIEHSVVEPRDFSNDRYLLIICCKCKTSIGQQSI